MVSHGENECLVFSKVNQQTTLSGPSFTVERILGHSTTKLESDSLDMHLTQPRSRNGRSIVIPQLPAWIYATRFSRQGLPPGYNIRRSQKQAGLAGEKKVRQIFSSQQTARLENEFDGNRYVTASKREELASALGLTETQVKTWFQNRRTKWRKGIRAEIIGDQHRECALTNSRTSLNMISGKYFHDPRGLSPEFYSSTMPTVVVAPCAGHR